MVNNRPALAGLLPLLVLAVFQLVAAPAVAQDKPAAARTEKAAEKTDKADKKKVAPGNSGNTGKGQSATEKPAAKVEDLGEELKELQDVQTGLILTLAACGDEPHCVTGVNDQELASMQERLQQVTSQLEQESPEKQQELRKDLQALRDGAARLQASVSKVETEIDASKLQGNWSDQFVFDDFNAAPAVPFPNAKVPLGRFEDAEQPLPIE